MNINWKRIEELYFSYIDYHNGELDYDQEYDYLKRRIIADDGYIDSNKLWKNMKKEYFRYINDTNNEDSDERKFDMFRKMFNHIFKDIEPKEPESIEWWAEK